MAGELIDRSRTLWKDRARALQIRIRDRFRVAVDRHRLRHRISHPDYPLTRWIRRLWPDPLASSPSSRPRASYRFYRKRIDKNVDGVEDSVVVRMLQAVAVPVIGNVCHVFMHGFNHVQIYGAEKLHRALLERPQGKPLITVSNHVAAVDDPFVIASLLPPSVMLDARNLRWTLCATDRCFRNPVLSAFFQCLKVLPVSRGDGIYQKGMDMALSKLNSGGWVHIFPEGSRSRDGGRTMGSSKRGIGRLVMDADNAPVVIPFIHTGMQDIMPVGSHFPKIGKMVTVLVGDPVHLEDLLVSKDDTEDDSRGMLYDAVSSRIDRRLQELKVQAEKLALEQSTAIQDYQMRNTEKARGIWQQVDWEAFGMANVMSSEEDSTFARQVVPAPPHRETVEEPWHQTSVVQTIRMGFSYEEGIVSRVRGCMNPSEFMGFAARGLFMDGRMLAESRRHIQEAGPVKAWKQFVAGSVFSLRHAA
ncbi:tafazzin-like [Iris pallida]|uniref:Tafazzin-like n=1 Tax=Iris pallida TaxID=29817 RepID=A0AAX6EX87_IRIPA|nr:tafazzin-like [Iris pallida]